MSESKLPKKAGQLETKEEKNNVAEELPAEEQQEDVVVETEVNINEMAFPDAAVYMTVNGKTVPTDKAFTIEAGNSAIIKAFYSGGLYNMPKSDNVKWKLVSQELSLESSSDVEITPSATTKGEYRIDVPKSGVQQTYLLAKINSSWKATQQKASGETIEEDIEHQAVDEFTIHITGADVALFSNSYAYFDYTGNSMFINSSLLELDQLSKSIGQALMADDAGKAISLTDNYISLLKSVNESLQKEENKNVKIKTLATEQGFNIYTELKAIDNNLSENRNLVVEMQKMTQQILQKEAKFELKVLARALSTYVEWSGLSNFSAIEVAGELGKAGVHVVEYNGLIKKSGIIVGKGIIELVILPFQVSEWVETAKNDAELFKKSYDEIQGLKDLEDFTYQAIADVIEKRKKINPVIKKWEPAQNLHLKLLSAVAGMNNISL